jgi:hypothetical protein
MIPHNEVPSGELNRRRRPVPPQPVLPASNGLRQGCEYGIREGDRAGRCALCAAENGFDLCHHVRDLNESVAVPLCNEMIREVFPTLDIEVSS